MSDLVPATLRQLNHQARPAHIQHLPPSLPPAPIEGVQLYHQAHTERRPVIHVGGAERVAVRANRFLAVIIVVSSNVALAATLATGVNPKLAALTMGLFTVCGLMLIAAQRGTSQ